MANNNTLEQFTQELSDLLKKYDVSISFDLEGDTYGVHGEKFLIKENKSNKVLMEVDGYWLNV